MHMGLFQKATLLFLLKGMMIEFAKRLADFSVSTGKEHVAVLSSIDFGRWQSNDMWSGLQVHYLFNTNKDGTDDHCENLGWKRLQEFDLGHRRWKYLNDLAEGSVVQEEYPPLEDEQDKDEDYYPILPFAALYSLFQGQRFDGHLHIMLLLGGR